MHCLIQLLYYTKEDSSNIPMIKALTQIVIVDIGTDVVSMSIVEKQNQSGFKFNQRLLILVHGVFMGYISKVKMNDEPTQIRIVDAKVKVSIKNLYSAHAEDEMLKIKFTIQEEGQVVSRQWTFKLATSKLALLWKQYIDYEIKARKTSPTKKTSRGDLNQSAIKKNNGKQENGSKLPKQNTIKQLPKPQIISEQKKEPQSKEKANVVVNAKKNQPTKVFENPFFQDGDDSDQDSRKKEKKTKTVNKQLLNKQKDTLKDNDVPVVEKINKNPQKPVEAISINNSQDLKPKLQNKEKEKPVENKKVQQIADQKIPKIEKKISTKFELTKIQEDLHEESPKILASKLQVTKQKPAKAQPEINIKQTGNHNTGQKQTLLGKQIDFMKQIILKLDQKHKKTPIHQIVYDHEEVQKLLKMYEHKLGQGKRNKNTENLLNHILEAQKLKLNKENWPDKRNAKEPSWIFQQFSVQQTQLLLKFQDNCNHLMKELYLQLSRKIYVKFQKLKQQKHLIYFKYQDIDIKIPLITLKEGNKSSDVKLIDKSAVKIIKNQFKGYQYLYKIIDNKGIVRVPLCCLCEYGGLTALFKVRPIFFEKNAEQIFSEQKCKYLAGLSNLPLLQSLKNKIRPLNQFIYNEMRQEQTSHISFHYYFIEDIPQLFIYDLNYSSLSQTALLRMQLVEKQVNNTPLPFITKLVDNKEQNNEAIKKLSNTIHKRIQSLGVTMNNLDFIFIHPKQLSLKMHLEGINMRYLNLLHQKVNNIFVQSLLLSQMTARVLKSLFMKTLQDECFQHRNSTKLVQSQLQRNLVQKIIDFMNCFFGNSEQSKAMWVLTKANLEAYFKISVDNIQMLNKGQLLISSFYHCNLSLKWNQVNSSLIFRDVQNFNKLILNQKSVKTTGYKPQHNNLKNGLIQKLRCTNNENFQWIVNSLSLKSQNFPKQLRLLELEQDVKIYLSNFIEAEQLDWSNNYSHLSLYQTSQPSMINYKLDLALLRWLLRTDCKFKYLNKFNQFSNKILKIYGNNHFLLSDLYEMFANHHRAKGQVEDCISFIKSSILNLSALGGDYSPKMAEKYYQLAKILIEKNRNEQAKQYLKKAKTIIKLSRQKTILEANIKLNFALLLFNDQIYDKIIEQLQNMPEFLQSFEKNINQSYESQRLQLYQLLYISNDKLKKNTQNKKLCEHIEKKLKYFKSFYNFQQILWMIIQFNVKNVDKQNQRAISFFWNSLTTKQSINYYKKSYQLLRRRQNESSLFQTSKKYFQNSSKIVQKVKEKALLSQWQNLKMVYERETLFDFVSFVEQVIYMMGRDRLNTIQLK